ncbi:transcription factor domain-containing protein [Aspergillus lucknowensis]|uniref:Fungal-specific transcription factor domain-containing protein n=1 Tax=Aspergillus lucknowensis TaxID=176173 RepID=A0ABR4LX60_9EURO
MSLPHTTSPIQTFKSSGWEENTPQGEPTETLFWEGVTGEMTLGRTYPSRLHDIHDSPTVPDQSLNPCNRTTDRVPVETDLPPTLNSSDNPQFSPASATSPNIPSFLNYSFSVGQVPQPISFVRPALDISQCTPHYSPLRHDGRLSESPSAGVGINGGSADCTLSPSDSHGALSPRSLNASLFTPGTPRDQEDSPDSFLAGILDGSPGDGVGSVTHTRSYSTPGPHNNSRPAFNQNHSLSSSEQKWETYLTRATDSYGMDCGRPDMDLGKNDDHSAIDVGDALDMFHSQTSSPASSPRNPQLEREGSIVDRSKYDYYALPVPVNIPRCLSPLPASLVKVPINLMYFHHFLNHTARVLVPHDCGDNPFSSVLPSMAIADPNLLNLMLAYSASHRARFLGHPEPANRIALWVRDVFPSLRVALEDPQEKVTDSHLATAIMLLSLKIVSPSTFEVPVPWQSHLKLARDLFLARQGQMAYPGSRVGAFLTRWIGYLDILGALSCRYHHPPLLQYYTTLSTCCANDEWDEFAVDCFTGFTPRTGLFLMQLGGLVHQCDNERFDDIGSFSLEWKPSPNMIRKAETLIADWETLDTHVYAHEKHYQDSESSGMVAVDRAFRYAGLVHLLRRVLGQCSGTRAVSNALTGLIDAVTAIRSGAAMEAAVLFPIFTAGCETEDIERRSDIKERLEVLEGTGMKQIQIARTLMQRCWDTGLLTPFPSMEGCSLRPPEGRITSFAILLASLLLPIFVMLCVFVFFIDTRILSLTRSSPSDQTTSTWRRCLEGKADEEEPDDHKQEYEDEDEMASDLTVYSTDLLDGEIEDLALIPPLRPQVMTTAGDENAHPHTAEPVEQFDDFVGKLRIPSLESKWDGKIAWALKGASIFDSIDEEFGAFNSHSNMLIRQPYSNLWVFQYGLRYIPSVADNNVYRAIRIDELPPQITLSEILPLVVGEVYCARLADTAAITGFNTAMITFVTEKDALRFIATSANNSFPLPGKIVPVHTPTYPMPANIEGMIKDGYTRCLAVSDPRRSLKQEITRVLTRTHYMYSLQIQSIDDGPVPGEVAVSMFSVKAAAAVFHLLQGHLTSGKCQFRFLKQDGTPSGIDSAATGFFSRTHGWALG